MADVELFGVRPLRVESVAWVAERKDVLSTFFWMLTRVANASYTGNPPRRRYLGVVVCLALGRLAKPMLGTLLEQQAVGAMRFGGFIPFATRLQNAALTCVAYLGKTVVPTRLAVLYPHRAMTDSWSGGTLPAGDVAASVLLLVAIPAAVFLARGRRPYLLVGWLWYLTTLAPVLGIIQVGGQAMADRYTYVPQVGILFAVVWGLRDLCRALRVPAPARRIAASAMLGGLVVATS